MSQENDPGTRFDKNMCVRQHIAKSINTDVYGLRFVEHTDEILLLLLSNFIIRRATEYVHSYVTRICEP